MIKLCAQLMFIAVTLALASLQPALGKTLFPGKTWQTKTPAEAGLDTAKLDAFKDYVGGRGCIVRHGCMVYTWGDYKNPGDVASAAKPVYTHFLLKAVEEKKIAGLDEKVLKWEPRLNEINASLNHKDSNITWRHMANQISCYGVSEPPGDAYNYNDWQMALFFDTLFLKVYGASYDNVDEMVLRPRLTNLIGCEDNPTFMAFGTNDRPGRFAVSPRDFARIGLLYLHKGNWNGEQLIDAQLATMAVTSPLPNLVPRTKAKAAEMIPGQRSLGSLKVPDDGSDHYGSYSWLWWLNGITRERKRHMPEVPEDVFGAYGHDAKRAMIVLPGLDLIVSWNDTRLDGWEMANKSLGLLGQSVTNGQARGKGERLENRGHAAHLPRLIVTTDISSLVTRQGEPDDTQSLVRMLLYSNEIDIEGLVATYTNATKGVKPEYLRAIISEYAKVRENLLLHDPRYPTADYLFDKVKAGLPEHHAMGEGKDTEGSEWIIKVVDKPDPRPVWIAVWGGPRELAQALWKVEQTRSAEELAAFKSKIRVHAITDQDNTAKWIREKHPDLFYITDHKAFRGLYKGGDASLVTPKWVDEHVNNNHGPLGAAYPNYDGGDPWGRVRGIKEGDTPSFFYVLPNNLSDPEQPNWGNWGGRFEGGGKQFFDAKDSFGGETSERATIYRWRPAFQASFQARLDWCVKTYKEANHEPSSAVTGDLIRQVAPGAVVDLDASLSSDPDGDSLSYDWYWYQEPSSYKGDLVIENSNRAKAGFVAPKVDSPQTVHIILTVTDDGKPPLSSYRRVVVTVDPTKKAFVCGMTAAQAEGGLKVENGWFTHDGRVIWGYAQHNGWWGGLRRKGSPFNSYKVRTNITRNAPGRVGPDLTEDLDKLTDAMVKYGYPGFEHCYGLWYDRRRDAHDTEQRKDANVVPPLLEQPWARSETGTAWEGLPKYDLTKYNDWYFKRLREFAALCDKKGAILFHNHHMQHALLEQFPHYADFPWRPANCIQDTGMPDNIPAANAFYDVSNPVRRELHRAYIRKCLDELSDYANVIHLTGHEYTGPLSFMQFWMDTIDEWEKEKGKKVQIGLGATKDVMDAILSDPKRGPKVSTIDLRYWWYKPDGSLHAPPGGKEVAGRYSSGSEAGKTTPQQIYRQVREYRDKYPECAIIHTILPASREITWAFLMGGGSMLIERMEYADSKTGNAWDPPSDYIAPPASAVIQPTYDFIKTHLAKSLPKMKPADLVLDNQDRIWCLADPGKTYLVYALQGGEIRLNLQAAQGDFEAKWLNPRTGELLDGGELKGGGILSFKAPDGQDWTLYLVQSGK